MSQQESIQAIEQAVGLYPGASVYSTGSEPASLRDLLIIGDLDQDQALSEIHDLLGDQYPKSYVCDDAVLLPDIRVGIAYREADELETYLSRLALGYETDPVLKTWTIGPWLPEAFAYDIAVANPIVEGDYTLPQDRYLSYPEPMREAIVTRSQNEVEAKTAKVDFLPALEAKVAHAEIAVAGLRAAHALGFVYFRGLRYLEETTSRLPCDERAIVTRLTG